MAANDYQLAESDIFEHKKQGAGQEIRQILIKKLKLKKKFLYDTET